MRALIDAITLVVGPKGITTAPADMGAYLEETRGLYHGTSPAVVKQIGRAHV